MAVGPLCQVSFWGRLRQVNIRTMDVTMEAPTAMAAAVEAVCRPTWENMGKF